MAKLKNQKKSFSKNKRLPSVKGLSTDEILKMDVYKLGTKGLRQVLNRLISTANKRIRRLENQEKTSPALASLHRKRNYFSSKGLNYRQLQSEFKAVKNFLQAETSTITGFKKYRQEITYHLDEFQSEEQESEFWEVYNKWIDTHPNLATKFKDTNELQQMVYDEFVVKGLTKRGTSNKITHAVRKMLGEVVAKQSKDNMMNEDVLLNGVKRSDF